MQYVADDDYPQAGQVTGAAAQAAADNPYRAWIDTYADPSFGSAVKAVIAATDTAAEQATPAVRTHMMTAFIRCSQYEWLFWDGAHQLRGWPIAAS